MKGTDYFWLTVIASAWFAVFLIYESAYNGGAFAGFPVDDGWIHVMYAHNASHGDWFVYTGTEHSTGDTSPLWVAVLAGVYRVVGTANEFIATRILCGLGYLLVGWGTAMLTFRLTRKRSYAMLAGAAVLSTGEFIWMAHSGMETTMFAALLLSAVISHLADTEHMSWRTGLLFGLAAAARPEAMLVFAITLLTRVLSLGAPRKSATAQTSLVKRSVRSMPAIGLFLLPLIPYAVFCQLTTGHLFPNTFYAKSLPFSWQVCAMSVVRFFGIPFAMNLALFAFALFGALLLFRHRPRNEGQWYVAVLLFVFPIITALTVHVNIGIRYMIPFYPLFVVLVFIGFSLLPDRSWSKQMRGLAIGLMGLFVLTTNFFRHVPVQSGLRGDLPSAEMFARNVRNINDQQVQAGQWLHEHTGVDDVIATNDIGAIAFFSQRRIVDIIGLVSNDLTMINRSYTTAASRDTGLARYLASHSRPRYIAYFEKWFPSLPLLLPVDSTVLFILPLNTISGADTMTVSRLDWSRTLSTGTP